MNTVNVQEIQNFSKDSSLWWDEKGPFKPLHLLNPTRLSYIRSQICRHFKIDESNPSPFQNLKIIDVGCGGGLVCEPLVRLGGNVTGIDADTNAIEVAQEHAKQNGLEIFYLNEASENITEQYDVVLALEIIEHVDNPDLFIQSLKKICKPNGIIIFSTINRTLKSYALAIIAAEHILRWVPQGTHHWKKFVKPSELSATCRKEGMALKDSCGLIYNPLLSEFYLTPQNLDVNYFMTFSVA